MPLPLHRWMNKFPPTSPSSKDIVTDQPVTAMDFDCGDLVVMTVVDVFETDAAGKLLSYCPTFDNRSVRKTPEITERFRKGASQLYERFEVATKSPAAVGVNKASLCHCIRIHGVAISIQPENVCIIILLHKPCRRTLQVGKMSIRAALVMGNALKNKVQQQKQHYNSGNGVSEEDQLNELLVSQIVTDETDVNEVDVAALEDDPTDSSPVR